MSNETKSKKTAALPEKGVEKKVTCRVTIREGVETSVGVAYKPAEIGLPQEEAGELAKAGLVTVNG